MSRPIFVTSHLVASEIVNTADRRRAYGWMGQVEKARCRVERGTPVSSNWTARPRRVERSRSQAFVLFLEAFALTSIACEVELLA